MERRLVYSAIRTPDGTLLESRHRHDCKSHLDKNGKIYILDGGTDYVRCSDNGDEEFIQVYRDEPFEKIREYVYRLGYGKPGTPDYGVFRKTILSQMTDEHLQASLEYPLVTKGGFHWQLLLEEKLFRSENEIYLKGE